MTGLYRIADKNIQIDSVHEDVHAHCKDYRAEGEADFEVRTTADDIAFERQLADRRAQAEGRPASAFSDGYLEKLAVYRKIAEKMPEYDTFLFHGSCVAVDGEGYIFAAMSGTGKSTHARLWRELLGGRAVMVNDDKPLIRVSQDRAFVYGTPWNGKHRLGGNLCVPLKAVCELERAEENRIASVPGRDMYPMMLRQTYRPRNAEAMMKTMQLVDRLIRSVRFYRLGCNMDISAAELSYTTMKEGKEP